jgi:hypothetical protein
MPATAPTPLDRRIAAKRAELGRLIALQHRIDIRLVDFPARVLGVENVAPYQREALRLLETRKRVAIRGPHGIGKSSLAAWCALYGLCCFGDDFKVVTTASAWRQLTKYLWPELHKWAARVQAWPTGRPDLMVLNARRANGEAFAVSSNKKELIEGAHAKRLLYILDESKSIPADTWDAIEGAFANGDCWELAISTPGEPNGRFYDIHSRKPGYEDWAVLHVTLEDAIAAGRVSREWAEQRKLQWGEQSPVYQNRVLGEFATSTTEGILPLAWVELANERWQDWAEAGFPGRVTSIGVDVGGGLEDGDQTTLAPIVDAIKVREIRRAPRSLNPNTATMETAGIVKALVDATRAEAHVDVIGIGAGVVHRCVEQGAPVLGFNAARATGLKDRSGEMGFANWRAAGWWTLREMLDPISNLNVCLPPDDALTGELIAPHFRVMSHGVYLVESKKEIRKRLGRSTDAADAVIHGIVGPVLQRENMQTVRVSYDPVQIVSY